jgi:hypothetical protein
MLSKKSGNYTSPKNSSVIAHFCFITSETIQLPEQSFLFISTTFIKNIFRSDKNLASYATDARKKRP